MTPDEAQSVSDNGGVSSWNRPATASADDPNVVGMLALLNSGQAGLHVWDCGIRLAELFEVREGFEAMGRYLAGHADFSRWCEVHGRA